MRSVLWVCATIVVGLYICGPLQDPDLWWHLTVGRWILAHGKVPTEDLWGLFSAGQPWRAYSWSTEVLFALADRAGGMHGLLTLKMLLGVLLAGSLSAVFSLISRNWFLGLLLGVFVTAGCYNHFTLRPQSLVWVWFAFVLLIANTIDTKGLTWRRGAALAATMMLWANTHLTSALGVVAAAAWVFRIPETVSARAGRHAAVQIVRLPVTLGAIAFLGTLLTPYLGGEWLTLFSKTSHPSEFNAVAEFQPATVMQFPTAFLMLGAMLLVLVWSSSSRPPALGAAFAWVGFILAGLAVVKFIPFALILTGALIARGFAELKAETVSINPKLKNLTEGIERLYGALDRVPREGFAFLLLCIAFVSGFQLWKSPVAYEVVPESAVDFIEEKGLPFPIANIFGHGGYLIYRFSDERGMPRQRVAIDGRTNLISREYWQDYIAAMRAKRSWEKYFDRIKPGTLLWRDDSPLPSVLIAAGQWCQVHESGSPRARISVWIPRELFVERRQEFSSVNCDTRE
jgi:hypothetical protein